MSSKDIIYFSVNNWNCGKFYPDTEIFRKWLGEDEDQYFMNDEWCKESKFIMRYGIECKIRDTTSFFTSWVDAESSSEA